jgi:hypothetical protein
MHIDLDFARRSGMVDVFAHGMLSMAYLGRLLRNQVTCSGRITELLEKDGERLARVELQTANQFGETKMLGDALVAL